MDADVTLGDRVGKPTLIDAAPVASAAFELPRSGGIDAAFHNRLVREFVIDLDVLGEVLNRASPKQPDYASRKDPTRWPSGRPTGLDDACDRPWRF